MYNTTVIIGSVDMLKDVVVVLVLLLILAGDVELNPGPGKCEFATIIYHHVCWVLR